MERTQQQPGREHSAPAPAQSQAPVAPVSDERMAEASAQLSQGAEPPQAASEPSPEMLNSFEAEGPAASGPVAEPESKPEAPSADTRSVNELAQDPKVREAIQRALENGSIRTHPLKAVLQQGLETGEFHFRSEGQERVVRTMIADAIQPAKAHVPEVEESFAAETGAGHEVHAEAPQAEAPKQELAKPSPLEKAFETVDAKLPDGVDARVKDILRESPTALSAKNTFEKGKDFTSSKPSVGDAVRYTNAVAVKTGDFSQEAVESRFAEGFGQKTKGDLLKLAESNGVTLYPESKIQKGATQGGSGRSPETPVEPDSKYGRAIAAAAEKGIKLPTPANGEAYTVGEARDFHEKGLIHLESLARTEKPAAPEVKPEAAYQEKVEVFDRVLEGYTGKDGNPTKGIPLEDYKRLSRPAQNELRSLVGKLDGFASGAEAAGSLAMTTALAKEFKEQVLDKQSQGATA